MAASRPAEPAVDRTGYGRLRRTRELASLVGYASSGRHGGWYFTKWQRVLNDGLDAVMHVLTSPSEDAREMRQNSPFAGILPEATRVAVLRSFKDHWDREHERAMTE